MAFQVRLSLVPLAIATFIAAASLAACSPSASPTAKPNPSASPESFSAPTRFEPEQLQQAVKIEQMRGHLIVAMGNLQAGKLDLAKLHAAHPSSEGLPAIQAPLKKRNASLAARTEQTLVSQLNLFSGTPLEARKYEASVAEVNKVLDEVYGALIPSVSANALAFQGNILAALLESAVDEYSKSITNGIVKQEEEYQDGYGFFQRVRALWRSFEDQVKAKAPHEYEEIEEQLDLLKTAFSSVIPPSSPMPPEQVEGWAKKLIHELAEATGFEETAVVPATSGSSAEQLKVLSQLLDRALDKLKVGDVVSAKREYREFDEGWERVEDGVRAKSRDHYRKIEEAMGEVKSALIRPEKPDSQAAVTALKKLDETIDAALPSLR